MSSRFDSITTNFIVGLLQNGIVPGGPVPLDAIKDNFGTTYYILKKRNSRGDPISASGGSTGWKFAVTDPKWTSLESLLATYSKDFDQNAPTSMSDPRWKDYQKQTSGGILPIHARIIDWIANATPEEAAELKGIQMRIRQEKANAFGLLNFPLITRAYASKPFYLIPGNPWRDVKSTVLGAALLQEANDLFPWPEPRGHWVNAWLYAIGPAGFNALADKIYRNGLTGAEVYKELINSLDVNWDATVNNVQEWLDDAAKRKSKRQLWSTVVIALFGAALAPVTAGASLALVAIARIPAQIRAAREAAEAARAQGRADADELSKAADAQDQAAEDAANETYDKYTSLFTPYGYTREVWNGLTTIQKLNVIDALANAPPGPPVIQPPSAPAPIPPPEPTPSPETSVPIPPSHSQEEGYRIQPYVPPSSVTRPPAASGTLPGTYTLIVEGVPVINAGTLEIAAAKAVEFSEYGDRVEISFNGKSMGLGLRSNQGIVQVPPDVENDVRAMSPDQVKAMLGRAEATAGASRGGGFPLWILAVPAAIYVASK